MPLRLGGAGSAARAPPEEQHDGSLPPAEGHLAFLPLASPAAAALPMLSLGRPPPAAPGLTWPAAAPVTRHHTAPPSAPPTHRQRWRQQGGSGAVPPAVATSGQPPASTSGQPPASTSGQPPAFEGLRPRGLDARAAAPPRGWLVPAGAQLQQHSNAGPCKGCCHCRRRKRKPLHERDSNRWAAPTASRHRVPLASPPAAAAAADNVAAALQHISQGTLTEGAGGTAAGTQTAPPARAVHFGTQTLARTAATVSRGLQVSRSNSPTPPQECQRPDLTGAAAASMHPGWQCAPVERPRCQHLGLATVVALTSASAGPAMPPAPPLIVAAGGVGEHRDGDRAARFLSVRDFSLAEALCVPAVAERRETALPARAAGEAGWWRTAAPLARPGSTPPDLGQGTAGEDGLEMMLVGPGSPEAAVEPHTVLARR